VIFLAKTSRRNWEMYLKDAKDKTA